MTQVYRAEVLVCATAYVKADSPEQAREVFSKTVQGPATIDAETGGDVGVTGADLQRVDDYALTLSPAMTLHPAGTSGLQFASVDFEEGH